MSAPERIWAEMERYAFPGFDPAWVWHSEDSLTDGTDGLVLYVRADIAAAQVAAARAEGYAEGIDEAASAIEDVVAEKNPSPRATAAFLQIVAAIRALIPEAPK